MANIIYKKDIDGITMDEKDSAEGILNEFGERVEKRLDDDVDIEVYVKNYGKIKTNEYEVSLRILCSGKRTCSKHFFEAKATERDFRKAVSSCIDKLNTEIEHKLHLSNQGRR